MLGKKAAGGNVIKWLFKYLLFTFLLFFFVLSVSAKIVLAESILVIDEEAFLGDTLLEEVGIPDNTVAIGSRAFAYTSLRVITIPFSVQEIAKDAFEGVCTPLLIITDPDSAAVEYALNNNRDFRANSKFRALIIGQVNYPAPYKLEGPEKDITKLSDLLNEYEVTIKTNLTANEMLDSVSKVFSEAKSEDISLFYYCGHGNENDGALIGIDMDSHVSATDLRSVLDGIPGRKIVLIDACYSGALIGRSLSKNNEDPSLKFINAFTRRSRSADLKMNQYSVTRIGECAFSECSALKEIELPTHMEAIEYRTFYMCTSLSRVTVKKDIKNHVHTPYVISGIDSTCTERGYTDATVCIDCGATIENSKPIAAKGHNWGRWVTTRAATVQQQGLMERTCTVCGEKESSVIARMHPVSIENAVVTGINEMTYTGTALKPSPTVSVRGEILKAGTDYTVTYSNNVDAGKNTAIIIITGKGNYTGTKRIPFTISRATQSITGLSASYTKTYGDKAFTLGAKAKTKLSFKSSKSTVVVVDTEGKVTIKGAGKATITVTAAATGNYNVATKTVTVTVSKASQSITGLKGTYKKTFGNKAFPLGAKAKTKRTYKTSNKMVATVDKKGQVTIKGAGTAKITITAAASANYKAAKKTVTLTVAKAAATVKATASKKVLTLSSAKLAQKNLVVNPKITCSSKGSRSYENVSTNKVAKEFKVSKKTGKITVPKNTAKGTYSVKIKVTVKEKGNFKKTIKTLTVKVIVK